MAKRCTVCPHPKRKEIDRAILSGRSARAIGLEHGFLPGAIWRHRTHVESAIISASAALEASNANDLVVEVTALKQRASELGAAAEATGDYRTALMSVRELTRLVELVARLSLEARAGVAADVAAHPVWKLVAADTVRALEPFPVALAAVRKAWEARLGRVPLDSVSSEMVVIPNG